LLEPAVVDTNLVQREQLVREVAARVHNVISDSTIVCPRCGGADIGICRACSSHLAMGGAADRVIPLVYAPYSTQIRRDLRTYKEAIGVHQTRALKNLQAIMWNFSYRHEACLAAVSGQAPTVATMVPSGTPRVGLHPFEEVARTAPASWMRVDATRIYAIGRTCDHDSVAFADPQMLAGRHVAVLDDSWATGSKADGVAMAARRHGAVEVSVIVVARIVNDGYGPAAALLERIGGTEFQKDFCPVTRGACP